MGHAGRYREEDRQAGTHAHHATHDGSSWIEPGRKERPMKQLKKMSLAVRGVQFLAASAATACALVIPAGAAQAQATVMRFTDGPNTETFQAPLEGCLPSDLVGNVTQTETTTGQVVDTGKVFTVHGVSMYDYHGDFPNGIYVQSGLSRDIFTFVANPPLTVFSDATQDFRTIYAADGTPIGTLSIHETIHVTFRDTNGNGEPDPGEISVQIDHFRLRCG
jgi:hypothetical protein